MEERSYPLNHQGHPKAHCFYFMITACCLCETFILFIIYLLTVLNVCCCAQAFLGLVSESGGYSPVVVHALIIAEFGHLVMLAQYLWHMGLVVGTQALD